MWRALVFIILLSTRAQAAGPQPCYFQGAFTKCFTTSGILVPQISWTDTTKGILGTTTNDSAGSGYVGESKVSFIAFASRVTLTSSTFADITNIVLTAGDWDLTGLVCVSSSGTTTPTATQGVIGLIGTASGNNSTGASEGDNWATLSMVPLSASASACVTIPPWRVSISAGATYYLKGYAQGYSVSTLSAFGRISGRRIR